SHAFHSTNHEVARHNRADAFRWTRDDQASCLQLEQARQVGDRFSDMPDHLGNIALLTRLAVHFQRNGRVVDVSDALSRVDRPHGCAVIEGLTDFPGTALFLGLALEVATGHVQTDGEDRKSTRLNSSHVKISYAVFCLKNK